MVDARQRECLLAGVTFEATQEKLDEVLRRYKLIPNSEWENMNNSVRRQHEPEGTKTFALRGDWKECHLGRIIADIDRRGPITPAEIEEVLAETRRDIPDAQIYLCRYWGVRY